jgi:DNA/RNA-binding domain of Phe-tRNA-synthetase-like protein
VPWKRRNGVETIELRTESDEVICTYDSVDQMPDALLHQAAPEMYAAIEQAIEALEAEYSYAVAKANAPLLYSARAKARGAS